MATLSEVVAYKVGNDFSLKMIQDGSVKVNGMITKSDHQLYPYDIIEFSDRKQCFVGIHNLVEADDYSLSDLLTLFLLQ